jgi:hypothetical protein
MTFFDGIWYNKPTLKFVKPLCFQFGLVPFKGHFTQDHKLRFMYPSSTLKDFDGDLIHGIHKYYHA